MTTELAGQNVVVTGGAGLLGRAFVEALVGAGAAPVIAEVDLAAAEQLAAEFAERGQPVSTVSMDITSPDSVTHALTQVCERHGSIHALVNNAYPRNKDYGTRYADVEYESFCDNVSMNLGGCFLASKVFGEHFRQQGFGNIVNIASIYGVIAPRFEIYDNTEMTMPVEYAVIKSGLIHLTKYLAKYYKGQNVRVNSISPGGIIDQQDPSFLQAYQQHCLNKGMLDPNDIVGTLLFLLSASSKYINGQNIVVDDGFTL